MRAELRLLALGVLVAAPLAFARTPPPPPTPVSVASPAPIVPREEGIAAFADVMRVLQSPRCQNCHPAGDAPLQTDASVPHAMGITRDSPRVGLHCATCHREVGLDLPNTPPANPHWGLPPANQVFEGRSAAELCRQLNEPDTTGGRSLAALLEHVRSDSLVLYGWSPGGGRTTPPLSHEQFVARFGTWVAAGGPCPD